MRGSPHAATVTRMDTGLSKENIPIKLSERVRDAAEKLWAYHQLGAEVRPADFALGLGSHDLVVADACVELYERQLAPLIVFSGANSPTTKNVFPDGEAVAYQQRAIELGVPPGKILVEPLARNTGENISRTKALIEGQGLYPSTVILVTKPYMQRRAYATCRKVWPELEVVCFSKPMDFDEYLNSIRDSKLVVDMLVGDLQRIKLYAEKGFAIDQEIPVDVQQSFEYLVAAGFTSRLVSQ